jgi:F-type H+-transporting ATPase subunit delta
MTATNVINGYAQALFDIARVEGNLETVSDELFRFVGALESSDQLQSTLSDALVPAAMRQSIVEDLLGGRASQTTIALISFVVAAGRARDLPAIVHHLVERAAFAQSKAVAEVRTAVALTDDQKNRLSAALGAATGTQVELKVVLDETLKGGLVAQVGDTLIDGSVRRRLDQLKSLL